MSNAKKFIKDAVFSTAAETLAHLSDVQRNLAQIGIDANGFWDMIRDNFAGVADPETGELVAAFGPDETGAPAFDPALKLGNIAVVIPANAWDMDNVTPQAEGAPLATPRAIYVVSLPKVQDTITSDKLRSFVSDLILKAQLTTARNVAKKNHTDPDGAPLVRDNILTMIAGATRGTGNPNKAAIKAMMPFAADVLLAVVGKKVTQLKAAGHHAQARQLAGTFNRARLNVQTMEECLSSKAAAEFHFGSMAQAQWETLLNYIIEQCPKHTIRKILKDDDNKTRKDEEGNTMYSDPIPAPVSPVVFLSWLETRDEVEVTNDDTVSIDLGDLMGNAA